MKNFENLGLSEDTLKAVAECGYTEPTPIQEKAVPAILMMRDVIGLAQTGTGKTASFTLPMIDILSDGRARAKMPRSLILSPTRELAAQIAENFEKYGKYHALSMALLVGGVSMGDQLKKLEKGVDVLIATPGRLLDLFERGAILLNDIKIFVIDEADRMLDMGFIPDIEKIAGLLPASRQTLLFSATMAKEIRKLTEKFLNNPKEVSVAAPASTAKNVEQGVAFTTPRSKNKTLLDLIQGENVKNAFVFCNRKRDIAALKKWLVGKGLSVGEIHGDMVQKSRTETLNQFKKGEIIFLVCSDVVARGIDVQGVSHVFNYDVPMHADDYVHRIGRTGRAGQSGRALMLATENDRKYLEAIEKNIGKPIPVLELSGATLPEKSVKDTSAKDHPAKGNSVKEQKPTPLVDRKKRAPDDVDDVTVVGFGDEVPAFFKIKSA
ncbi:MAG: DEAD/DEAH box helicase [Rhodospirillales bacterium]|nr:DEAD/DEAH box helicase [Rhodospirillales bacterium]